jgi:hypothetical protein
MSITDPQLVNIEIATLPSSGKSGLRLTYQGQKYDLLQAFGSHKLDAARQQWQQLMAIANKSQNSVPIDSYLLVREIGYCSLWKLDRAVAAGQTDALSSETRLELQQASIWLLQELWLQWQDLLGARQLQVFAKNLVSVTSQLQSGADLDRLLAMAPLATIRLTGWSEFETIAFARQLYHLTQQKLGQQFGTKLTIDIIQSMPGSLQSTLIDALDIQQYFIN